MAQFEDFNPVWAKVEGHWATRIGTNEPVWVEAKEYMVFVSAEDAERIVAQGGRRLTKDEYDHQLRLLGVTQVH